MTMARSRRVDPPVRDPLVSLSDALRGAARTCSRMCRRIARLGSNSGCKNLHKSSFAPQSTKT